MVALARATMSRPRLLLLDEPSLGLAPMIVARIMQQIAALRGEGGTVLIVEQNAHAALAIADRGYVLENGRIALEGRAADLLEIPPCRKPISAAKAATTQSKPASAQKSWNC